jgi:hypothetical protein
MPQPGAPKVIVLSHALWQERFGSRADVVGTALVLDDESYEIVGIAPAWDALSGRSGAGVARPIVCQPSKRSRDAPSASTR